MASLIHQIIDETAGRLPAKEAFRFAGEGLGYADLATRSDQLACALAASGVRRGGLVGILMARSLADPVAVFGIQKAGAAYVPLDPAAPDARIDGIVRACGIRHVVTDDRHAGRLAAGARAGSPVRHLFGPEPFEAGPVEVVPWRDLTAAPAAAPDAGVGPGDPAYVIFTSGSTGTPKGIVHTHASGLAYARMAAELYGLHGDDRLSNFPPLHFDQSTFDFFSGPLAGATTVIVGAEHQLVPASLSKLIEDERLTVWYSVPFALRQLLHYGVLDRRDLTSLRWVIYGGEPFPPQDLAALMALLPTARFSNCYGPAETNQCTYHHLGPGPDPEVAAGHPVPIGRPCPGVTAIVAGPDGQPVAAGEPGELLIGSPTTMQGYRDAPELDAAVFGPGRSRRYYRTGDLVRRRGDGLLEFLGRKDRQVKTRGFRVELDEVEAVLAGHPDVIEAAVYPVAGDGTTEVHAVLILRPGADAAGVRGHASRGLPHYAVPTRLETAGELPRTATGKVDYPALSHQGVAS